jgi:hypothetical protein
MPNYLIIYKSMYGSAVYNVVGVQEGSEGWFVWRRDVEGVCVEGTSSTLKEPVRHA